MNQKKFLKRALCTGMAVSMTLPMMTVSVSAANPDDVQIIRPYVTGMETVGTELEGKYTYYDVCGQHPEAATTFQWLRSDTKDGEYTEIANATTETYTLTKDDVGKYIKFEVDPHLNGKESQSWMIGPVLSEEQYAQVNNYFGNDNDYTVNVNTIQAQLAEKLANAIYFTVDSEDNGDKYVGSEYIYQNNVKKEFQETDKPVVVDKKVYAPAGFFTSYLGVEVPKGIASEIVDGVTCYDLKAAVEKLGKQYWSGDAVQSDVENFQMEHLGQGLVVISDTKDIFDPVADRDLIDEACNMLYTLRATDEQMQWFRDAKYGMFMHWDPSSISGVEISWDRKAFRPGDIGSSYYNEIDKEYDTLYKEFNPVDYNPDEWMQLAKDAGMKYVVLTTKHHGSFSNFFTDYDNYSIKQAPYGKDIVKQYVDAAHKAGLKVGFYYSARDWYNPNYLTADHHRYLEYYFGQIQELLSNYGKIDIMWFDSIGHSSLNQWDPRTLLRRMKQLQPDLIVNNRYTAVLAGYDRSPYDVNGDWYTPEHRLGGFDSSRPWESCMTVTEAPNGGWSYRPNGRVKTVEESVKYLINNVVNDGNLLYNIGPMPNGKLNDKHAEVFRTVGEWMEPYKEAIYGTRGGPYINQVWGGSTYRVNDDKTEDIYLHVSPLLKGHSLPDNTLQIAEPSNGQVYSEATLVKDGTPVTLEKNDEGYLLTLPEGMTWDKWDTVIKMSSDVKSTLKGKISEAEQQLAAMKADELKVAKERLENAVAEAKKIDANSSEQEASEQLTKLNEALAAAKSATELYNTIALAEEKLGSITVGSNPWECPKNLADALKNQIAAGKEALANEAAGKEVYDKTLSELKTAMDAVDAFMANLSVEFTPSNGKVSAGQSIGMATNYEDLTIHYTLDGSEPTKDSPVYGDKLPMNGKIMNIKAAVFDQNGKRVGSVCEQTYLNPEGLKNEAATGATVKASNVYKNDSKYTGDKACDNSNGTRWATDDGTIAATLEVDFGSERSVNSAMIEEYLEGNETSRISQFQIEYWDGTNWQTAYKGDSAGAGKAVMFPSVTTTKMRLNITACMNVTIWEFSLYNIADAVSLSADKTALKPGTFTQLDVLGSYADGRPIEKEEFKEVTYKTDAKENITINENGVLSAAKEISENMAFNVWAEVTVGDQKMTTEKIPMTVDASGENLALNKPAESSSNWNGNLGAGNAVDGNQHTRWASASNKDEYILTVDLGKGTAFDKVCFDVYSDRGDAKNFEVYKNFKVQALQNDEWVDVYDSAEKKHQITYPEYNGTENYDGSVWVDSDGNVKSTDYVIEFDPVVADKVRLYSNDVEKEPSIIEFEVYSTKTSIPDMVEVSEVKPVTVENGTAFEDVNLPQNVEVTFDDGSRAFLSVTWDKGNYNGDAAGTYQLTGQIELIDGMMTNSKQLSTTVDVIVEEEVVLDSIAVSGSMKTEYLVGDKLDLEGLVVTAYYSDGSTKELGADKYRVSGFDSDKTGEQTITVTYKGQTATFTVTVKEKANKDELAKLVKEVEDLDLGKYTDESVALLKEALKNAKDVLENDRLSVEDQGLVDEAVLALKNAKTALTLKTDADNGNNDSNGNNSNKTPETGDASQAAMMMLALMSSGAACLELKRRKK